MRNYKIIFVEDEDQQVLKMKARNNHNATRSFCNKQKTTSPLLEC